MTIIVNGSEQTVRNGITLEKLILDMQFNTKRIAVDINGAISPKSTYSTRILTENDKIEVVTFVGGG